MIRYCYEVATSPDVAKVPDPVLDSVGSSQSTADDRTDPYLANTVAVETRRERLARLLENEKAVERIIRNRSWTLLAERCRSLDRDWGPALEQWRAQRAAHGSKYLEDSNSNVKLTDGL